MSRASPGTMLLYIMLMLGGLYSITSVLLTEGNSIGQMCQFLLAGGFLFCFIAPRQGFFCWLLFCGYNDLLKRLLVIGGRVSMDDLKFVLGITPAMFAGVVVSLILGGLMQSRPLTGRDWMRLAVGIVLMLLAGVLAGRGEGAGLNGILQAVANNGLYSLMIFVMPLLFRTEEKVLGIWRFLVLGFLPVAMYGVVQQLMGFADFEVEYLLSGLSLEVKQLVSGDVRAFSTLNSPTALSVVCACLAVVGLALAFNSRKPVMSRPLAALCFVIHCAGLMASTSRTALLILPLVVLGGWCFVNSSRTRAFYTVTVGGFLALVAVSPWLAENLDAINLAVASLFPSGGFMSQMLVVGTYWDRLEGFATVLMNPEAWSWFGHGPQDPDGGLYHYHDPISATLVEHGAVVLVVMLVVIFVLMLGFHRQAWNMRIPSRRRFAAQMTALVFALLLISALSGNVVTVFPNNVILWCAVSTIMALALAPQAAEEKSQPGRAGLPANFPPQPLGRVPRHEPWMAGQR